MRYEEILSYEQWRSRARELLRLETPPSEVIWTDAVEQQNALPGLFEDTPAPPPPVNKTVQRVPKEFLELAPMVACYRDPQRWALLYRVLYRITHGEHDLLHVEVDDDVRQMRLMEKAVNRDLHKMKAFVRFRKVTDADGGEEYVAWHRPEHHTLELGAPFFVRRFGVMRWAILTPEISAYWDQQALHFGPGVPQSKAPAPDTLEDMWRSYYAAVFNPARLKLKKMKQEMPLRHWPTLPEARIIPQLVREAEGRVERMAAEQPRSATEYVPATPSLPVLRDAVQACQGCELYQHATQAVFGEGPTETQVMFIGEQPGDEDDMKGKPFSGPAGRLLDQAFAAAGIDRTQVYITNVVKHFKFSERGKRRIHVKANSVEAAACRPWLEAELAVMQPKLIVCLGATAAQAIMGRAVTISRERGEFRPHHLAREVFITMHPSAILRVPDADAQEQEYGRFVADLKRVREKIEELRLTPALAGV